MDTAFTAICCILLLGAALSCDPGYFGPSCSLQCRCTDGPTCNSTGHCQYGCEKNYYPRTCHLRLPYLSLASSAITVTHVSDSALKLSSPAVTDIHPELRPFLLYLIYYHKLYPRGNQLYKKYYPSEDSFTNPFSYILENLSPQAGYRIYVNPYLGIKNSDFYPDYTTSGQRSSYVFVTTKQPGSSFSPWNATLPARSCATGKFGSSCGQTCQCYSGSPTCDEITGHCAYGCASNWVTDTCGLYVGGTLWPGSQFLKPTAQNITDTEVTLTFPVWTDEYPTLDKTVQYQVRRYALKDDQSGWNYLGDKYMDNPMAMKLTGLASGTTHRVDVRTYVNLKRSDYWSSVSQYSSYSQELEFQTTGEKIKTCPSNRYGKNCTQRCYCNRASGPCDPLPNGVCPQKCQYYYAPETCDIYIGSSILSFANAIINVTKVTDKTISIAFIKLSNIHPEVKGITYEIRFRPLPSTTFVTWKTLQHDEYEDLITTSLTNLTPGARYGLVVRPKFINIFAYRLLTSSGSTSLEIFVTTFLNYVEPTTAPETTELTTLEMTTLEMTTRGEVTTAAPTPPTGGHTTTGDVSADKTSEQNEGPPTTYIIAGAAGGGGLILLVIIIVVVVVVVRKRRSPPPLPPPMVPKKQATEPGKPGAHENDVYDTVADDEEHVYSNQDDLSTGTADANWGKGQGSSYSHLVGGDGPAQQQWQQQQKQQQQQQQKEPYSWDNPSFAFGPGIGDPPQKKVPPPVMPKQKHGSQHHYQSLYR